MAVEACPSGMVMFDGDGTIMMVNGEIERMFGYASGELIGQPVQILVPEGLRGQQARRRDQGAAYPQARLPTASRDLRGLRRDMTEFPVEVALNPIHAGGDVLVLSVMVDISERKRVERLKDDFVSTVSHELRTPLTSITGALGLLMGNTAGKLPDTAVRLLGIAHANSQRLVRLVNDILDIEKIESGNVVFDLARLDVRSLVEQAVEANRSFAQGFDVGIEVIEGVTPFAVRADADRLIQIVTNLLSNAVKFSPKGEDVTVSIEPRGEAVRISVRDKGPGIPPDFRSHIFEKFAQADASDTRQKGGTGLGLSIVKQLTIRLGGEVSFEDAPGGGTIFHVDLPSWDYVGDGQIDLQGDSAVPRVLLCENDLATAITLRKRLRLMGCATDFACTGGDALTQAASTSYAAIVVDMDLSDIEGVALILDLRKMAGTRHTPIIAISPDPQHSRDDPRSANLDILDWLAKPLDIGRLVQVLDKPIARHVIGRPLVLHVDDDADVLRVVARALEPTVKMVSVSSVEGARREIKSRHFDLAILDVALGQESGLSLLPHLRDVSDKQIPVIVFSAQGATLESDDRIQLALGKSQTSINQLMTTILDRLALQPSSLSKEFS